MSDIAAWLKHLGLGKYQAVFAENDVDFEVLPELTEQDLEKLGISLGHRKKLLKAIANLSSTEQSVTAPVAEKAADLPPSVSDYTPQHLAERILNSRNTIEGERKQVTVLFADIKGSTELVENLDPEQANRLLDPALKAMMDAVHRFEGTVNKVQGDGVMALFGAPLAHEDHAVRACYAALTMQRMVAGLNSQSSVPIQIRVGLHSGEVVVRGIGNDLSMNYDAVGMTVHLAARMEQTAPAGGIYLSSETMRLAEGFIEARDRGFAEIKGISESVQVYQLDGETAARTRWQASLQRGLSRFVGRDEAIKQLAHCLDLANSGQGQIAAIVGDAGVGKSRLVYEFIQSVVSQNWQVMSGSSVSYGKATDWLPVVDLLRNYFAINDNEPTAVIQTKIERKLATLDTNLAKEITPLSALFDIPVDDTVWHALGSPQRRWRTLQAIQTLVYCESEHQPLLLVFEDLHWIDGETQALLDELIDQLPGRRILLLVNYRPEYRHDWAHKSHYLQLRLDPLEAASITSLLDALLGFDTDLQALKVRLSRHTGGNPLFIEESVRMLLDTGILTGKLGAYRQEQDSGTLALPDTIQALIAQRIDGLDATDKQLLQTAAVIGTHVPLPVLEVLAENTNDALTSGLERYNKRSSFIEARYCQNPCTPSNMPIRTWSLTTGYSMNSAAHYMLKRPRHYNHFTRNVDWN